MRSTSIRDVLVRTTLPPRSTSDRRFSQWAISMGGGRDVSKEVWRIKRGVEAPRPAASSEGGGSRRKPESRFSVTSGALRLAGIVPHSRGHERTISRPLKTGSCEGRLQCPRREDSPPQQHCSLPSQQDMPQLAEAKLKTGNGWKKTVRQNQTAAARPAARERWIRVRGLILCPNPVGDFDR
jgi:hypothetical protein